MTLPAPGDVTATLELARMAEGEGYDDVWFADSGGVDALTAAAAVAVQTRRVRIGTAIVPVYTRTPAVLAASAMTLSHLAPGRFLLGLGASSHAMIEGWHGLKLEAPLTRVKETALLVRELLAGGKTNFDGQTLRSKGYALNPPAQGAVPILLAGLRGKMLEMAGEVGDGVVINLFPYEVLPRLLAHVDTGARRAGTTLAAREIVCRHQICVTHDKPAARERFRKLFAPYYATPVYNQFLAWCGYADVAETITQGWLAKDRARTAGALSDDLVERIAIIGPAEECQARVAELAKGGVTTHIVSCFSDDPQVRRDTLAAFHPGVFRP